MHSKRNKLKKFSGRVRFEDRDLGLEHINTKRFKVAD